MESAKTKFHSGERTTFRTIDTFLNHNTIKVTRLYS